MQAELLTLCTRNRSNNMVASFSKQRVAPTAIFPVVSFLRTRFIPPCICCLVLCC